VRPSFDLNVAQQPIINVHLKIDGMPKYLGICGEADENSDVLSRFDPVSAHVRIQINTISNVTWK
jgi:hypothetical protein